VSRRIDNEARADASTAILERRVDSLVTRAAVGDDDPAAGDDGFARRIDCGVPGAPAGREVPAPVGEAGARERAIARLVVAFVTAGDLQLEHCVPELEVGARRRVEGADFDVAVRTRMIAELAEPRDEADALVDVVARLVELLPRPAERAVGAIPREGAVPDPLVGAEFTLEELLPASPVTFDRRLVEEQEIAPVVSRVRRRAKSR
jgi:hypothetical protein